MVHHSMITYPKLLKNNSRNLTMSFFLIISNQYNQFLTLLRRATSIMTEFQQVAAAYERFMHHVARNDGDFLMQSGFYPEFPDVIAMVLHSLSHVLHNLSDIMINHSTGTNGEEFRLFVPRNTRPTRRSTILRPVNDIRQSRSRESDVQSEQVAHQPASREQPLSTSRPNPSSRDNSSFHLTVQFTTDIGPYPDVPDMLLFHDSPTSHGAGVTPPNSTRTTSDGTDSAGQSRAGDQLPDPTPNQTLNGGRLNSEAVTASSLATPVDSFLNCYSYFSNTSVFSNYPSVQLQQEQQQQSSQDHHQDPHEHQHQHQEQNMSEPPPDQLEDQHMHAPTMEIEISQTISDGLDDSQPIHPPVSPQEVAPVSWTQLFPEPVIPIIERDLSLQKNTRRPQSFSDGYICCSPLKRKHLDEQEHAATFLTLPLSDVFIQSLVNHEPGSVDVEGLKRSLEENRELSNDYLKSIEYQILGKLMSHDEFDPVYYPMCHKFKQEHKKVNE
ncbi:hypothetical protein RF11_11148 [Thelohanellus kitauei]|uniref:Uncharacterized protein n=1 Tax=Thelohanellus kitauei TaxID=669202 RepID=A0A0C2MZM6_THEKT|nr:hypothetical protein RF11_11148 [Thelohanellus kitauei]